MAYLIYQKLCGTVEERYFISYYNIPERLLTSQEQDLIYEQIENVLKLTFAKDCIIVPYEGGLMCTIKKLRSFITISLAVIKLNYMGHAFVIKSTMTRKCFKILTDVDYDDHKFRSNLKRLNGIEVFSHVKIEPRADGDPFTYIITVPNKSCQVIEERMRVLLINDDISVDLIPL